MSIKEYLDDRAKKCRKRIEEIDKEMSDLAKKNEASEDETELKAIGDSLAELEAEKAELVAELKEVEAQIAELDKPADDEGAGDPKRAKFLTFEKRGGEKMNANDMEKRMQAAEEFRKTNKMAIGVEEARATLVSSGTIATPTEVNGIVDTFNRVSSIVDLVKVENCEGMGANKVAYEVSISEAGNQTEGQPMSESDPVYDFVEITPTSIGVVSYISKQVRKQSPLNYQGKIVDSAEKALRVKAASVITAAILASDLIEKPDNLAITAIDDTTLRKIAFNYGSDESIYGNAWLFLTKKDLIAFGDVRSDTTLQAVYEITPDTNNPNTGVIKDGGLSVRYCLNPNLTALADAEAEDVAMFYGQPECAELDLFSDYEIKVSEDFKITSGMLTIVGDAELGAAVIKKGGFVCVTKGE